MKLHNRMKLIGLPTLAVAFATVGATAGTEEITTPAPVTVTTPDWLKISGYAAASYTYSDFSPGGDTDSFFDAGTPFDAVKLGIEASKGAFSIYGSLFYSPTPGVNAFGGGGDAGILDAYLTYTAGNFKVTAGKYLSYMGFEAFDTVNMYQMSYANTTTGGVPAYHSGVKLDYSTELWGAGFNISDSLRGPSFWEGDGDYGNGLGYEAYVTYKGIDKVTLWAGAALDDTDGLDNFLSLDFWASYEVSDKLLIAGEIIYAENTLSGADNAVGGLAFLKYSFTDKFSTVFRLGIDAVDSGIAGPPDSLKYTVAPAYAFNDNFTLRGELSFIDFDNTDQLFAGVQALLTF